MRPARRQRPAPTAIDRALHDAAERSLGRALAHAQPSVLGVPALPCATTRSCAQATHRCLPRPCVKPSWKHPCRPPDQQERTSPMCGQEPEIVWSWGHHPVDGGRPHWMLISAMPLVASPSATRVGSCCGAPTAAGTGRSPYFAHHLTPSFAPAIQRCLSRRCAKAELAASLRTP